MSHLTLKELCGLTLLVYKYTDLFMINNGVANEGQTISEFIELLDQSTYIIDDTSKAVLQDVSVQAPNGMVELFTSDKITDLQVGITRSNSNKRICVVFCGTQSHRDWYYNLMISKTRLGNNVHVHTGFHEHLHATGVYELIAVKLESLMKQYPTYQVFLCGHSLGGALSTLFGYEFKSSPQCPCDQPITVVSFGSPRVGDYNFAQVFEATRNLHHFRVVNDRDFITTMPPYQYYHCGKNICMYNNSLEIYSSDYNYWWQNTLLYYWSREDHDISMYYDRLDKFIHCEV